MCIYGQALHPLTTVSSLPCYFLIFIPSSPYVVRPAKLPNLQISNGNVFSWSYPDSWEKPCTFFGLQFQVKMVQSGHTCDSEEHIMVIKKKGEKNVDQIA